MAEYLVTWEIDLIADSPEDAASQAFNIQQDPLTSATFFTVEDTETKEKITFDLVDECVPCKF